jgi:hypothetical protein
MRHFATKQFPSFGWLIRHRTKAALALLFTLPKTHPAIESRSAGRALQVSIFVVGLFGAAHFSGLGGSGFSLVSFVGISALPLLGVWLARFWGIRVFSGRRVSLSLLIRSIFLPRIPLVGHAQSETRHELIFAAEYAYLLYSFGVSSRPLLGWLRAIQLSRTRRILAGRPSMHRVPCYDFVRVIVRCADEDGNTAVLARAYEAAGVVTQADAARLELNVFSAS